MDDAEVKRRQHLHQNYVGDVILVKSLIPDAPLIASFDERKTKDIVTMFPSK